MLYWNEQGYFIVLAVLAAILSVLSVIFRFVSRRLMKQSIEWDDKLIALAAFTNVVVLGVVLGMVMNGLGLHASQVPYHNFVVVRKALIAAEVFYTWILCGTKVSILLMYARIFGLADYFRPISYVAGAVSLLWGVIATFVFCFMCVPIEKLWRPDIPGQCLDEKDMWLINGVMTLFTDVFILLIPLPYVWSMRTRITTKFGVTCAFALGAFVTIASVYRLYLIGSFNPDHDADFTYAFAPIGLWSEVELAMAIISASLPVMKPCVNWISQKLGWSGKHPRTAARSARKQPSSNERSDCLSLDGPKTICTAQQILDEDSSFYRLWVAQAGISLERIGTASSVQQARESSLETQSHPSTVP